MKKVFIVLLSLFFITTILFADKKVKIEENEKLTGKKIAEMVSNANKPGEGLVTKGTMILENLKTKEKEERTYIILNKQKKGKDRILFRFLDSSYKGTTFLTIEKDNGEKIQYIYLKSIGSPRQVEASNKENFFVDTDITNEDMGGSNINDYTYKRLKDKKYKKMDCYVIERYPKNKNSKYKKYEIIIDKKTLLPVMVKVYSKEGRLVRKIKSSDIKKIDNIYIPKKTEIINIKDKHKTILLVKEVKKKKIPDGYFNKNRMNKKWNIN